MQCIIMKNLIEKINPEIVYKEYYIIKEDNVLKSNDKEVEKYIKFINKKVKEENIIIDKSLQRVNEILLSYDEFIDREVDKDLKDDKKLEDINRNINNRDIERLLYINFKDNDKQNIYLYSFRGFTNDFIDNYKMNLEDSFFKFLLDKFLSETNVKSNIEDYLTTKAREYVDCITEKISLDGKEKCNEPKAGTSNLFDEINYISTLTYEGANVFSKLAIMNEESRCKFVEFYIELDTPINFNEYRKIRKLLETASNDIYLIGDSDQVYGLGKFKDYENMHNEINKKQSIFIFEFIGKFQYNINNVIIKKSKIINKKNKNEELIKWNLNESNVINVTYGKPSLRENNYSEVTLEQTIDQACKDIFKELSEEKIDKIKKVIKYAKRQKHGTTVVITEPSIAKEEVEIFKSQSIKIKARNLDLNDENLENVIYRITNIDGAVYIDTECLCHSIGVILDGMADSEFGDSSRGARYNSAIKYSLKEKLKGKCIVVVISEDGMVNVISDGRDYKEHVIVKKKKQFEEIMGNVITLYNERDYESALDKLNEIINTYGKNDKILTLRATVKFMKGDGEEAIKDYDEAIRINPNEENHYIIKGRLLYNLKKYEEAIIYCEKAILINSQNDQYHADKGDALYQLDRYEEAIECYEKSISLSPENPKYHADKGDALYQLDRYEEAIECYEKSISLSPENPKYYANKGDALYQFKKYEEAIECYEKSISLSPENPKYYSDKGDALYRLKKYEGAIEYYEKSISLSPENPKYYSDKGDALYRLKRYEEAIGYYEKSISLSPENPKNYGNKGNALYTLERYEEAIECYEKSISLSPENPKYYGDKGDALCQLDRYEEAIECYEKAISLDIEKPQNYADKGHALYQLERYEEALECFEKAISLNPEDPEYYDGKGYLLYELGKYEEAIECYDKAIFLNLDEADYYNKKGCLLSRLKKYEEAIEYHEKAILLNDKDAEYYNDKGEALYNLKKYEEAILCYEKAIELNSDEESYVKNKENAILKLKEMDSKDDEENLV